MLETSLVLSELSICARCRCRLVLRRQRVQRRLCQTPYRALRPFNARYVSTAVDPGGNANQDILGDRSETNDLLRKPIEYYHPDAEGHENGGEFLWRRPGRNAPLSRMRDQQLHFRFTDGHGGTQNSLGGAKAERHVIDHNALGEPAEVVVLPSDTRPTRPTPLPAPGEQDEAWQEKFQLSGPEMLEEIARERGIVGEETWFNNMEDLKTELLGKHGRVVEEKKHLRDMRDRIYDSFTKPQLRTYIDKAMEAKATDKDNQELDFSTGFAKRNIARTAWSIANARALVPKFSEKAKGEATADRRREKNLKLLDKHELTDYVVRRVWNVQMRIDEGNNGKIGIRLKPMAFDLIVNHRENFLKGLADSYGVKIEAVRSLQIIWVTSDLEGCQDVWKSLCSMAGRVQSKRIRYNLMDGHVDPPKKPEEDALNEIGKLTNTKLVPVAGQKLDVHCLGPQENDFRDAQKMLVAFAAPDISTDRRNVWKPGVEQAALVSVDPGDHLPIRHRYLTWSRWSSSGLSKASTPSSAADEPRLGNGDVIKSIAKSMRRQLEDRPRHRNQNEGSAIWASHPEYVSRATLGQIIHPYAPDSKISHPTLRQRTASEPVSQLLTIVSGVRRPLANLKAQASNAEMLQITLSPTSPPHLRKYLPTLRITFNLDSSAQKTSLSSCQLITSVSEVDVMMPELPVDLRVSNTSHLEVSSLSNLDATISSFITESNLDIWHGNQRLSTPNRLKLLLPGHALKMNNGSGAMKSTKDKKPVPPSNHEDEDEINPKPTLHKSIQVDPKTLEKGVEVDYIFTGLEHQSTITAPYEEGTELKYTIVEAGKIGGKREELSVVLKDGIALVHPWDRAKVLWRGAERLIREIQGVNGSSR